MIGAAWIDAMMWFVAACIITLVVSLAVLTYFQNR